MRFVLGQQGPRPLSAESRKIGPGNAGEPHLLAFNFNFSLPDHVTPSALAKLVKLPQANDGDKENGWFEPRSTESTVVIEH